MQYGTSRYRVLRFFLSLRPVLSMMIESKAWIRA